MPTDHVVGLIKERGLEYRAEPFELASGELSHDYIDGKFAVATGKALNAVCEEILNLVAVPFDAVGGLTMGADALAHGVALLRNQDTEWFSVRKTTKSHGRQAWIEGARLQPGCRVLLVDDVVTTGNSILQAYDRVQEIGAEVVWVTTLVDRGEVAASHFRERQVPYTPLVTYRELDIPPVGGTPVPASQTR